MRSRARFYLARFIIGEIDCREGVLKSVQKASCAHAIRARVPSAALMFR